MIGKSVAAKYTISQALGAGGMGQVYLARQESLHRDVALKVLHAERAAETTAVERFKREAQIIARMGHPHIVTIHDFGTAEDGLLYIAMERLVGEDLAHRVARGPLPWPAAYAIVEQVARALAGAHSNGVIHRDLKPANIFIIQCDGVTDFVKVLDFGIARLVGEEDVAARLTGAGFVVGTPAYLAPENVMGTGSGADDARSDLYSLGVCWFEMLTGRPPFIGPSAMQMMTQRLSEPAPRPTSTGLLDLPLAHENLLMRLLEIRPSERPASAVALLDELAALRASTASSAAPLPAPAPLWEALPPGAATSLTSLAPPLDLLPRTLDPGPTVSTASVRETRPRKSLLVAFALTAAIAVTVLVTRAPASQPAVALASPLTAVAASQPTDARTATEVAPTPAAIGVDKPVAAGSAPPPPATAPLVAPSTRKKPARDPSDVAAPHPSAAVPSAAAPSAAAPSAAVPSAAAPHVVSAADAWQTTTLQELQRCTEPCAAMLAPGLAKAEGAKLEDARRNDALGACLQRCARASR